VGGTPLLRLHMPVLLHRRESKRIPCAAWFSFDRADIPEIHPEIPHGGIFEKLNVFICTLFGIPRSRFPDSRRWIDILLTPKDVSAIRHDEANECCAVFSCRTPERSLDCCPEQRHAGRPSGRPTINRCTANKEVICQSGATLSNRMQCLRL